MGPGADTRGQATAEVALLVPFIALVLLAIIQIGLVVHDRVMVTHAAREGVRVAAVGGSDDEVVRAVGVAGGLLTNRIQVSVARADGVATVTITYRAPTSVPLVGSMLDDVELLASATMRLE